MSPTILVTIFCDRERVANSLLWEMKALQPHLVNYCLPDPGGSGSTRHCLELRRKKKTAKEIDFYIFCRLLKNKDLQTKCVSLMKAPIVQDIESSQPKDKLSKTLYSDLMGTQTGHYSSIVWFSFLALGWGCV